jgi:hypothetical protein
MLGNLFLSGLLLMMPLATPRSDAVQLTVMSFNIRNSRAGDGEDS